MLVTARPGVPGLVSVIVPSRSERFLVPTVADLLANAEGDIEVIVVLDGYWPDPPLPEDRRIRVLHFGDAKGMRPAINAAATIARGEYLLKCDAHTMWAPGYDVALKADYHESNWIVVPRRYALDPDAWAIAADAGGGRKYPIDYHYLSNPYERPGDPACGLHGTPWNARKIERADILIDDEMSSQGSGWFMSRQHWAWLGDLDIEHYGNFIHEFQELGLKTWLGGGAVKVNKKTWYAHLFKGRKYGRGYSMAGFNHEAGRDYCTDFWMHDRWPQRVHDLRWLIEKFAPVPTWPADLDRAFSRPASMVGAVSILSARYGIGANPGEFVDVTGHVQRQLAAGQTQLTVMNDRLGGDPFKGKRKTLTVRYEANGETREASAQERGALLFTADAVATATAPKTVRTFVTARTKPGMTRKALAALIGSLGLRVGAEIGVADGRNALTLCQQIPDIDLHCVDPWTRYPDNPRGGGQHQHDQNFALAQDRLRDYRVTFHRGMSMDVVREFAPHSLDWVYIDGHHGFDYVMQDLIEWSTRVKPGGIVAGHDYYHFQQSGVVEAVDAYTKAHGITEWWTCDEPEPSFWWIQPGAVASSDDVLELDAECEGVA